jgi:hypothetical protein
MVEKRSVPRRKPSATVKVFDEITGKDLGHVANLTPEGLMLVSREPIPLSSIFQMRIDVPPSAKRVDKVCFGAESVWASQTEGEGGYFWSGFSIIDISGEAADFIERWIEDWTVDSE